MRIALCIYGVDEHVLERTEFYRQDHDILRSLGHEIVLVTNPLRLTGNFDLAVVWWWNYLWLWTPVAAMRRLPTIVTGVFDTEQFPTLPLWKRWLKARGTRRPLLNIFVSRLETDEAPKLVKFRPDSIRYSPLVVDTDVYRPSPRDERSDVFRVANVAWQRLSNIHRKMIFELLQAFARFHSEFPASELVLAGPPEDGRVVLEAEAKRLGVSDAVRFPGELTRDEKIVLMQGCSVYCQVSRFEGFGLATAEAMACGAPVIVSSAGAVPEVVGDAGFYVDEISTEGIYRALKRCAADPDNLRRMAAAGRKRIEEHISIQRRRRDFETFIDEAMRASHRQGSRRLSPS